MSLDEGLHDGNEFLEKEQVFIHMPIVSDEGLQQLRVSDKEHTNIANRCDSSELIELVEE